MHSKYNILPCHLQNCNHFTCSKKWWELMICSVSFGTVHLLGFNNASCTYKQWIAVSCLLSLAFFLKFCYCSSQSFAVHCSLSALLFKCVAFCCSPSPKWLSLTIWGRKFMSLSSPSVIQPTFVFTIAPMLDNELLLHVTFKNTSSSLYVNA